MAAGPGKEHGIVGRHRVQLLLGGIVRVLPNGVHPAPSLDPLTGLGLLGRRLYQIQNGLLGHPEAVQIHQTAAQTGNVHMALHQAGNDGFTAQIHHLGIGADVGLHTGLIAHIYQTVALDGDGADHREILVYSIDFAVAVHTVGGLRAGRRGGEEGEKHGKCQNRAKNASKAFA